MAEKNHPTERQNFLSLIIDFLTKETVKAATLQFRFAAFIKSTPFELEEKSLFRVRMFGSKLKRLMWHVANWTHSLQTLFLWISFLWTVWKDPFTEDLIMHLIYIVPAMVGWVFMTALYLKPKECLLMLNQHGLIVATAKDAGVKIPHWASHYFVILAVYYFAFGLVGLWVVQASMFLWKPTSSKHMYAYLPLTWQQGYAVFAVALIHELSWTAWYLSTLGISFCYWCADVFTINDILAGLMSKKKTTRDHVKLYSYLQLYCIVFNDYNGSLITVGFTTMVVVAAVIFIYLGLTATHLNLLIYLMLPVVSFFCIFLIMFFIPQHAKVGILSTDCVKILRSRLIQPEGRAGSGDLLIQTELGRKNTRRYDAVMEDAHRKILLKKRMRALPPLGVRIWFFGIYTLQTSQELMDQLFNNVLLLLSL